AGLEDRHGLAVAGKEPEGPLAEVLRPADPRHVLAEGRSEPVSKRGQPAHADRGADDYGIEAASIHQPEKPPEIGRCVVRAQSHTAPADADPTKRAYFASAPRSYRGSGAAHDPRRRSSSSTATTRSSRRSARSMTIRSPSRTSAIGPPSAASGAM